MQIFLDGLSITRDGFTLAEQSFTGRASVGSDGEIESIHLEGLRINKLRHLEKKLFPLDDREPLFAVIAAAIKATYGQQIIEYVEWNARQRPMFDSHRSMEAA